MIKNQIDKDLVNKVEDNLKEVKNLVSQLKDKVQSILDRLDAQNSKNQKEI
jgi:gas vesicle protein